jgi:hypothetical protein
MRGTLNDDTKRAFMDSASFEAVENADGGKLGSELLLPKLPAIHMKLLSARSFGLLFAGIDVVFFIFVRTFSVYGFHVDSAREFS